MFKLFNKTNKETTTVVKVRDRRDGFTVECSLDDAKNIVIHDWNMEIVEEDWDKSSSFFLALKL